MNISPLKKLLVCSALFLWIADFAALHAEKNPDGYYRMDDQAEAEADAEANHLPLVWLGISPELLNRENPRRGSSAEITNMCMRYLTHDMKGRIVVIFYYADMEISKLPPSAYQVFEHYDEGVLKQGMWYPPKIAITSGDTSVILGRVTYTQMKSAREDAIDELISHIESDPEIQAKLHSPPVIPDTPAQADARNSQSDFNFRLMLIGGGFGGVLLIWLLYRAVKGT